MLQDHEPLLTYRLYEDFMLVGNASVGGNIGDSSTKSVQYKELVDLLPPISRDLLYHVVLHLRKVGAHWHQEGLDHHKLITMGYLPPPICVSLSSDL